MKLLSMLGLMSLICLYMVVQGVSLNMPLEVMWFVCGLSVLVTSLTMMQLNNVLEGI